MNESSKNVRQALLYDERKLELGAATFLGAFNYWEETASLTFEKKLQRLQDLIDRNQRAQETTLHPSLNFHPNDKITDKRMVQIAKEYMKEIGFADQPWLAYRHLDAGHPHLHIVTTNIRPDGSRINNDPRSPHNLRKIYRKIENEHNLTHFIELIPEPKERRQITISPEPLQYGKTATKTGIAGVLDYVLEKFKFTSLDQLNALLYLYRVRADRGSENGIIYRNRGLYYRMIDETGKKIGAPIKASSFEQRPTLNYLEQKMENNRLILEQNLQRVQTTVKWTLLSRSASLEEFRGRLKLEQIRMIMPPLARNRQQHPPKPYTGHGFFYVDLRSKAIYRDTELGTACTAAAVMKRLDLDKNLLALVAQEQLTISKKERSILQDPDPNPAEKLRILLSLTRQHDQWQLKHRKERELTQERGLSLGL